MGNTIRFGTDGWRAVIGDEFTFENVRACTQAIAEYFSSTNANKKLVVVGYDTRFESDEFAKTNLSVSGVKNPVYKTGKYGRFLKQGGLRNGVPYFAVDKTYGTAERQAGMVAEMKRNNPDLKSYYLGDRKISY